MLALSNCNRHTGAESPKPADKPVTPNAASSALAEGAAAAAAVKTGGDGEKVAEKIAATSLNDSAAGAPAAPDSAAKPDAAKAEGEEKPKAEVTKEGKGVICEGLLEHACRPNRGLGCYPRHRAMWGERRVKKHLVWVCIQEPKSPIHGFALG